MNKNELLEEKWKTQKKMASKANYRTKKILDNAEQTVNEMVKKYGLKLRYAKIKPFTENLKIKNSSVGGGTAF